MARVKRGVQARRRHKKILDLAKGYYNARRKVFRVAKQAVIKAQQYAYIGRKQKKRNFRSLWIDPDFVPVPQPSEVAEVFEVPLDYLMAADNLRQVEINHRGRVRHVLEYGWPGQRIWGATAAILYNLRRRLEQVQ